MLGALTGSYHNSSVAKPSGDASPDELGATPRAMLDQEWGGPFAIVAATAPVVAIVAVAAAPVVASTTAAPAAAPAPTTTIVAAAAPVVGSAAAFHQRSSCFASLAAVSARYCPAAIGAFTLATQRVSVCPGLIWVTNLGLDSFDSNMIDLPIPYVFVGPVAAVRYAVLTTITVRSVLTAVRAFLVATGKLITGPPVFTVAPVAAVFLFLL